MLIGPSGSGKSSLALELMAYGAELVSDDRTILSLGADGLEARPPSAIKGLIEARGVGLLNATAVESATVRLVVDMGRLEEARLPTAHTCTVAGIELPCLHKVDSRYFPAAVLQYVKMGRRDPA
ncbi:aldolase [uncultured Roseobacter sp.]|uniref:HPr kinase/phosphorylase n=1 Tax=uncultured Roseobacter sp. TaxID=114847 RepID=UPI0034573770